MRAVVHVRYGPPDVLRVADVPAPVPEDDELRCGSGRRRSRTDCGFRQPRPGFVRLFSGLRRPRRPVLGTEFAGEVEAVGPNVSHSLWAIAFLGAMPIASARTPSCCVCVSRLRGDDAGGHRLRRGRRHLRRGDPCPELPAAWRHQRRAKILIYGASGAIGTAAVQLAVDFGADVTAVCHTRALEIVRSLGPRRVIDYTREDFAGHGERYDVILDAVGKSTFWHCRGSLTSRGRYLSTDLGPFWQTRRLRS